VPKNSTAADESAYRAEGGERRLFLIDGSALVYRAYFAFINNPLRSSRGENTSAVFGFTNTLLKLMRDYDPRYWAVVFDTGRPTFRHEQFPEYKASREEMPDDLRDQLPMVRELLDAMKITALEAEGYEADDIMAPLARRAREEGMEVVLVSPDKDLLQAVDEGTFVLYPPRGAGDWVLYDEAKVKDKLGVPPGSVAELLALAGDSIDDIPGLPGIGEKTARDLIQTFGSIEDAHTRADEIRKKSVRNSLVEHYDDALLFRELVQLCTDVPIVLDLEDLAAQPFEGERLRSLFVRLEFMSLVRELGLGGEEEPFAYRVVAGRDELADLVTLLKESGGFAIRPLVRGERPEEIELVGLGIATDPQRTWYVPIVCEGVGGIGTAPGSPVPPGEPGLFEGRGLPVEEVRELMSPLLADPAVPKWGHDTKVLHHGLMRCGAELAGLAFDSAVASYLLDPSQRSVDLQTQSLRLLGESIPGLEELLGKGKKALSLESVEVDRLAEHCCREAAVVVRLRDHLQPALAERELPHLYQEVEIPLIGVLARMERCGVAIDLDFFAEMSARLGKELEGLVGSIYELAGTTFNINSPKQLADILFDRLGLPVIKRTKTGRSTDVEVLERLAEEHPLPEKLLHYRSLFKLKSTYVDALPHLVDPRTGRIHTTFNQTATETGRLSSSSPNLQNIPVRGEEAGEIRRGFVPGEAGYLLLAADYSQIELRIVAHLSRDDRMVETFVNGEDIHTITAAEIFDLDPSDVTPDHRRQAKVVNFGIIYGMGPYGLAKQLDISPGEASDFISSYFSRYPKVNEWIERTIDEARERGYTTTLMQRRRYLPDISSRRRGMREYAERTAINTPVQGTAADLIKVAMINIDWELRSRDLRASMILQVHDELLFEVAEKDVEECSGLVRTQMESPLPLSVPIAVHIGVGGTWFEAH